MCRLGAVGSNPQYVVIGPSASALRSATSSVVCATRPRHCSSSRMSLTVVGSLRWSGAVRAQPALPPWARTTRFRQTVRRDGGLGVEPEPPRVASPSPPAPLTPTRGPERTTAPAPAAPAPPGRGTTLTGLSAAVTSRPFCSPESPRAWVSRAGPRARSRSATAPRRWRARSRPPTTSPARSRTALGGALAAADEVGAPVHAVAEVDVEPARGPEHDAGARGEPPEGVRPRVVRAVVRLDLGQADGHAAGARRARRAGRARPAGRDARRTRGSAAGSVPSTDRVCQPHHGIVGAVGDALLQGDQRVVGDLDVLGADLGAALGDVAQAQPVLLLASPRRSGWSSGCMSSSAMRMR